jgi:hypothetical protein
LAVGGRKYNFMMVLHNISTDNKTKNVLSI